MNTYQITINGQQVSTAKNVEVRNPATDQLIGYAPLASARQVAEAVQVAREAQPGWAALSVEERNGYLHKMAEVIEQNAAYLAEWITKEQGKPFDGPGSHFEVQACVGWTRATASLDLPVEVVFEDDTRRDELHRNPLGVVGAIAPWNWPLMIAIWQIAPSLKAGNTVIIKPSEYTPIGTLELVRLLNTVLPAGVLNSVSGDGKVGQLMVKNRAIDKIMFTGSVKTGQRIIRASADNLARLTLELGGNDAAIILPGADVAGSGMDLFWGAFVNMGQTCACIKRLYVHESCYNETIDVLRQIAQQMPMGDGAIQGNVLGPIQNRMQFNKVASLVEDAKASGARIVCGGEPMAGSGNFYPITLVADIQDGTRLVDEEQFGPVLPIIRYADIQEAVKAANRSEVGLGASVWGSNPEQNKDIALQLEAGTVWINQHGSVHPMVPFGGIKKSGYGLEFGLEGLKAVTIPKIISLKKAV